MSNSLASNKLVRTLKELKEESSNSNNIFVGKKFRMEYKFNPDLFYGVYRTIVVNHFISNTIVRATMYRNEINDNNIVLDEYREYSSSGLNGNFIVRNEYSFPKIKNTITNNEEGSAPFYFGIFEFWFDLKTNQLVWRIFTYGSSESKAEFNIILSLPIEDPQSIDKSSFNATFYENYYRSENIVVADRIL